MPKGKGKGKKSAKPEWMTDELWALSQNTLELVDNFRGPSDKNTVDVTISKEQAGCLLWKLLWPEDKKTKAKREEAVKAELLEAAVKNLSLTDQPCAASAAGLLALFAGVSDAERDVIITARPAPLPSIQRALTSRSTALIASACSLLKALAEPVDTRARVLKAFRDWDWTPLLDACLLQRAMGPLGARNAGIDAMAAIALMCGPPYSEEEGGGPNDKALAEAAQRALYDAGGLATLLKVCGSASPPSCAGGAAATTLRLFVTFGSVLRTPFIEHGGTAAMVRVMRNSYVELPQRAAAAGNLWNYLVPDRRVGPPLEPAEAALGRMEARMSAREKRVPAADSTVSMAAAELEDGFMLSIEDALLDPEERDRVLKRCEEVVAAGAITELVRLCAGPEGPLEDRFAADYVPPKSTKKKGGKKGKKKGKLEPGMEEAHTYASGCLRLISLDDQHKQRVVDANAIRYMTHLLESKVHLARWHARQVFLNLSMEPSYARALAVYDMPNYITGMNVPQLHYKRPETAPAALASGGLGEVHPLDRVKVRPQTVPG